MATPLLRLRWTWLRAQVRTTHALGRLVPPLARKPAAWERMPYAAKVRWRGKHPDPRIDYRRWVDKVLAKDLVHGRLPVANLLAVARRPSQIDPSGLPPTYVMKATHGYSMSLLVRDGVVVGRNRSQEGAGRTADAPYLREVASAWLGSKAEFSRQRRERQYALVQPGILFEERIDPIDHEVQLFLFRGRLRIAMVLYRGFHFAGTTHRLYDASWNLLAPGNETAATTWERTAPPAPRPPQEILDDLERLCHPLEHVRVDLYASGGRHVFSEFTFTHAGGQESLLGHYDAALGTCWER